MSKVDVRTLELGNMIAALTIDGGEIGPLYELHYVWITVLTPSDELVDFRFEVVEDRFMLKPDSYVDAIKEIEATCKLASPIDLEWLATMISQPLPGIGRVLSNVVSVGDSIEVGAFAAYGLVGSTRDVVLGTVQRIRLCM
jgi:hypothetical protein